MKKISVVLVFVMICLTSCIEMINEAAKTVNENANQNPDSTSESNFQTVSVEDGLYQLDVPNYMKEMKNLHPEASLEYANIYKEAYTVVIHEDKQEFIDIFMELDEYNVELSPIENYAIVQKKMFNESINKLKVQDYGLAAINGYPARQVKMKGAIDGIGIFYIVSFVEGPDNIYMIMNWTVNDKIKKLENTFEYISSTFKLI